MKSPVYWTILAVCAAFPLTAADDLNDRIAPTLKQISIRANECLDRPSTATPEARRECFVDSIDGNSFERVVPVYLTFENGDKELGDAFAALIVARNDKQVGAPSDSGGTTSLAVKGYAPRVLALAVERGAIAQQIDKNLVTFRATPAGLIDAFRKVDVRQILDLYAPRRVPSGELKPNLPEKLPAWAYNLSFAVSFDTNRGGQQGVLLANRQQVASWGGRYVLLNRRDAKLREYTQHWLALAGKEGVDYHAESTKLLAASAKSATMAKSLDGLKSKIRSTFTDQVLVANPRTELLATLERLVRNELAALSTELREKEPTLAQSLRLKSFKPFFDNQTSIYNLVNHGFLVTTDYTVTRDPAVPDLSTITLIAEGGLGRERKMDFTFNSGFSFYNASSAQITSKFHSFKTTSQLDLPLGKFAELGPFVLSLAGRYQRIPRKTITPGTEVIRVGMGDIGANAGATTATSAGAGMVTDTPEGNVGIGQIKLTIPMKDSGVKVPFSFSVSNRAGLIEEKTTFTATVGLTFDLDALFAKSAK